MRTVRPKIELPVVQAVEQQHWRSGKRLFAIVIFRRGANRLALLCLAAQLMVLGRLLIGELWLETGIAAVTISVTLQFMLDSDAIAGRIPAAPFDRPGRDPRDEI